MDKRKKEIYKELHTKYPDFVWKPEFMPILEMSSPLIRRFKVDVEYEEDLPKDGSIIFPQNHTNFYDSLVFDKALLNKVDYACFAGGEPRGTIQGLAFEAKGVVWVDRQNDESKRKSFETLTELLKNGFNLSWCPEGAWNLTDGRYHRLMLTISYGLAKSAIEASKYTNVYIVPVVTDYKYKGNDKVKNAKVKICKPVLITPNMDYKELTNILMDTFWTERWIQLEQRAKEDKNSIRIEDEKLQSDDRYITNCYVYPRKNESLESQKELVKALKAMYKQTDWDAEASYRIKTKEEILQEEMQQYINPQKKDLKRRTLKKF